MFEVLLVGAGGFLGSAARFLVSKFTSGLLGEFPLGTLLVNASASLLIGVVMGIVQCTGLIPKKAELFVSVGFLGGLSTFSAFSAETFLLLKNSNYLMAAGNAGLNFGISLLFVALGYWISTTLATLISNSN